MTAPHHLRYCASCGTRLAIDNRQSICTPCQKHTTDRVASPPIVLARFWTTPALAQALRSWHIGQVIRAYRHHPFHGPRPVAQEVVAGWLGLTQTQLSRIETGTRVTDLDKLTTWATALHIPAHLLWFKLPALAEPLALGVHRPPRPTKSRGSCIHATAALVQASSSGQGPVTDALRGQLDQAKATDGSHGPAHALPLVLGLLGTISEQVREVKPAGRAGLLSLGADGAEFAGWLYRDLHDDAQAICWYDQAMEWAVAASDLPMQHYVLLKRSQMAYDQRNALQVAGLAHAAVGTSARLPLALQAEITQQEALGLAMLGGSMGEVQGKIDQAHDQLAEAADHQADRWPGSSFTTDTLRLRAAACYTEAGKPARAATLFGEVLSTASLSRRDHGFFSARRAAALALSGEPDEAATVGLRAFHVAQETNSERTVRVLHDVLRTLSPWRSRPGPRVLQEALATNPR